MKVVKRVVLCVTLFLIIYSFRNEGHINKDEVSYEVVKINETIQVEGGWDRSLWSKVKPLFIDNYMGKLPSFRPIAQAKLQYDDDNIYVIFQVHDRYVQSRVETYNGPVSRDACVEFFFSPDPKFPMKYFNLEINASGIPLLRYNDAESKSTKKVEIDDLRNIEISHSLPRRIEQTIIDSVTWIIECRIPFKVLQKYGSVPIPKSGDVWRANFYKTASEGLNPHWITWSFIDREVPSFHLPKFFGSLKFK